MNENIKYKGKRNNIKGVFEVARNGNNVSVKALGGHSVAKKYVKYLTKKFLKRNELRELFRVIASKKDSYELRYYPEVSAGAEEEN